MAEDTVTRKLTAILYADVAGYSRLTGTDELGTHRQLSGALDFISRTIGERGGRVVHYAGDAVLADFGSVVAAVDCAVNIQRNLAGQSDATGSGSLQFRIGVNLGEVIVDRDDIFGDGVNVAARLEGLAEPGGICVSSAVFEQVTGKLDLAFSDIGPQDFKNIAEPVRTYRIHLDPAPGDSAGSTTLQPALPDTSSIAVLPFTNLSGDPEQGYLSDGVAEDIITSLSKISELFVIARNSSFVYQGKAVDVKEVSRALGVHYVLEGSVRKAGNRVRVTAQLIDGTTGGHLWAEKYDRDLNDIFAVQDDVTQQIVGALKIRLTSEERGRMDAGEADIEAYDLTLRARNSYLQTTRESLRDAADHLRQAIARDGTYARAHAQLAQVYLTERYHGWAADPAKSLGDAYALALRAVDLDPQLAYAHSILGSAHYWRGESEKYVAETERVLELDPNDADGYEGLAEARMSAGNQESALPLFDEALRRNPNFPSASCATRISRRNTYSWRQRTATWTSPMRRQRRWPSHKKKA